MVSCLNSAVGSLLLLLFISSKQVYAEPTPTTTSENTESDLVVILKEPFNSKVKGHYLSSFHGKKYYAFQDIPYAIPPINERRFKESEPVQQWKGIKDTVTSTKVCPQFDLNRKFIGDEDCLVLSVYTPVNFKNITSLIPVLFWIHGGSFVVGSGGYEEYNPAYFMDEDIVVVTINYRLGVLGFLSTEDSAMPTNLGLKDQRLALEWTYVNIERFGGDPENIVLMGESAGGTSIGYQLTENYEKPLFTGAILVSGTSLYPGYQANPRKRAFEVGKKLYSSFNSTNSFDLLKVLQNVTAKEVTLAGSYGEQAKASDSWVSVVPNDQRYFLLPTDSIEKGKFARVPLLLGFNSEEALSFFDVDTAMKLANELDKSPIDILGALEVGQNNATEVALKLKQVYTNGSFSEDLPAFVKYISDFYFVTPTVKHAESASKFVPVYLYEFSFQSSNASRHNIPGIDGTGHAADMPYYWHRQRVMRDDEKVTSRRFVKILTNFIKYKEPIPNAGSFFENITWTPLNPTDLNYLNFGIHLNVQSNPRKYRSVKKILDKYLTKPFKFY